MWSNSRVSINSFPYFFKCFIQPKRTTFILRRKNEVKLNKLNATFPKKLRRRNFYYELVEDTNCKKRPLLDLVLLKDVPGVGMKGEKIAFSPYTAYKNFLLPKLAVYASSEEGKALLEIVEERHYSSIYCKIVENHLMKTPVKIILSNDIPWTLQPWHVKLALRKIGILASDECITIPKEISGPNFEIENKDFLVYLTMNKTEKFSVRCRIYHWSSVEPSLNHKSFNIQEPSTALFPDEEKAIEAMLQAKEEIEKSQFQF